MDKVLEDYDPSRCQDLYSDDSGSVVSTRSDAVSVQGCVGGCVVGCLTVY